MENTPQSNTSALERKAVNAALKQNWKVAKETNLELLKIKPEDKKARMRLGRVYLQIREFKEAEKIFRKVLRTDPINTIAQKNLELAKSKKKATFIKKPSNKDLVKEPGTSHIEIIELSAKKLTADDFKSREILGIKVNKASANIIKKSKVIAKLVTPDTVKRLNSAKRKRIPLTVSYHSGKDNIIKILLKSDAPVFRAERQELKPYIKRGTIDEPAVEMTTTEEKK